MNAIVTYAIRNARLTLATLVFLIVAGFSAYSTIPKEAEPDIRIPIIYVSLTQRGISPEDAERLLLRPLETRLKAIANIKEMRAAAYEGGGYVLLEFDAGFDSAKALSDVRAKVDDGKRDLPRDADEPSVNEVNLSLFPVLVVSLGGDLPERTLVRLARAAKTAIEQAPGVLSAELKGARDEVVEIIAEPMLLKSYGVSLEDLIRTVTASNQLIAAGALEGDKGRFAVKVPSLIERPGDMLAIPIAASSGATVTLGEVADVRPTFKDAVTITRINGKPAITIEVVKRTGANIIETVDGVKQVVAGLRANWPEMVEVSFTQDKSKTIRTMLHELQNSVIVGIILVFIVILFGLGLRASLFVGIAIPASFLAGILGLAAFGLTLNIVVLFSLILAVGMLVDDAIIVTEFAERRMSEGMPPPAAYALAAERMAGPVIATTVARVAVFFPLLVWPSIVGQFMKYMPITLIATLSASLVFALIFSPTLGATFTRKPPHAHAVAKRPDGPYIRTVGLALSHPWLTLLATFGLLAGVIFAYGKFGKGVEFFPTVEPDYALVQVRARGNISIAEKDRLVREVEKKLLDMPEIETVYARAGESQKGSNEVTEDTIGTVQFEFVDWRRRRAASAIMDDIRERTKDLPGVIIEVTAPRGGPATGKPVTIRLSAVEPAGLEPAARQVAAYLQSRTDLRDIDDGLPLPGIDWRVRVDRAEAAKYAATAGTVGTAVQLVTNGVKVSEYRPNENDKAVDIIVRFPENRRTIAELEELRVNTPAGSVPVGNFVTREPAKRVSIINRAQGQRIITVTSNVAEGVQSAKVQAEIAAELAKMNLPGGVTFQLKGEDEERNKAGAFLMKAFGAAIFLVFAILLAQFNRFSTVGLILTAIVFSTIGVIIGLMVMGQAFGVVMTGIGIIANAGVIVNNNIVLIDLYERLRAEGMAARAAILQTCRERARPVLLTAVTAILGVLPIAFGISVDFIHRDLSIGAPSTQWWVHLSSATVFGLSFATVLTLVVTPAALMALANLSARRERWRNRKAARRSGTVAPAAPPPPVPAFANAIVPVPAPPSGLPLAPGSGRTPVGQGPVREALPDRAVALAPGR